MNTANENVLRALARVMAEARAGNVEVVAIVAVGGNGMPDASFAGEMELLPAVNIGIDMIKAQLVHRAMATVEQATTPIRRPVGHA